MTNCQLSIDRSQFTIKQEAHPWHTEMGFGVLHIAAMEGHAEFTPTQSGS